MEITIVIGEHTKTFKGYPDALRLNDWDEIISDMIDVWETMHNQ